MSDNAPVVQLTTNLGAISIRLDAEKAPASVENFLTYVDKGHYTGTIFHRVIRGFMIQGGGFSPEMVQKDTEAPIKNEASNGLKNARYTVAMARTQVIDSATSQFFINLADNDFLDHRGPAPATFGYAVFGEVIEGQDVVDKIANVPTGSYGMHQDVPEDKVEILNAERA